MKTSALDDFLSKSSDDDSFENETPAQRQAASKAAAKPSSRNTQAWRVIEDELASRRLDHALKEVYDQDA
jgi:hypothetical protein